jgi:nicotinamide-nucleotide amidase
MEMRLKPVYAAVPPGVTVTTLASPGDLAIHLTYTGAGPRPAAEAWLDGLEGAIVKALGPWIYARRGESLEEIVGGILRARGLTIACAESCTGGLIGHRLTDVPGSSDYFLESAVVYSNRAKIRRLGVPSAVLDRYGAVSAPVARSMAAGIRRTSAADLGLAVTGIAGPGGGTSRKPVGLVYLALATAGRTAVEKHLFFGGRAQIKFQSSQKALDIVRKTLIAGPGKVL